MVNISFIPGNTVKLSCRPGSNLARVRWDVDQRPITSSDTFQIHSDGLLILNASADASGHYTCSSVESSNNQDYFTQNAAYQLMLGSRRATGETLLAQSQDQWPTLVILQILVAFLAIILILLVMWNIYKGHFEFLRPCSRNRQESQGGQDSVFLEPLQTTAGKTAGSNSNNNHNREAEFHKAEEKDSITQLNT